MFQNDLVTPIGQGEGGPSTQKLKVDQFYF